MKGRVLEPGRLVAHCPVELQDFLAFPNPLGEQLVPWVNNRIQRKLVLNKGVNTDLLTLSTRKKLKGVYSSCILPILIANKILPVQWEAPPIWSAPKSYVPDIMRPQQPCHPMWSAPSSCDNGNLDFPYKSSLCRVQFLTLDGCISKAYILGFPWDCNNHYLWVCLLSSYLGFVHL